MAGESLFQQLEFEAFRAGITPRTKQSIEWFRNKAREMFRGRVINRKKILDDDLIDLRNRPVTRTRGPVGNMYMFFYDPKTKDKLPYYDTFPLIFPYEKTENGFMGINLHYLPNNFRALLMDSLYDLVNNKNYDKDTRLLRLSYERLNSASRFKYFRPCIKRYLTSNVRSRFFEVYPSEWDIALFLRTERFEKKNKRAVWQESRKIIKGKRA